MNLNLPKIVQSVAVCRHKIRGTSHCDSESSSAQQLRLAETSWQLAQYSGLPAISPRQFLYDNKRVQR